uniref:ARAD1B15972p n=1 Tax=Blastobotrys adeninivorans TaxID=409370 RepID=A0A060TBI3_BLAAD
MSLANREFQAAISEYESMVNRVEKDGDGIFIETKEGKQLRVGYSKAGWNVKGTEDVYETIEALLMDQSPAFGKLFHGALTDKLKALEGLDGDNSE